MDIKYCHVCISCKDWQMISKFYQDVFDCIPLDPIRHMQGQWAGELIAAENKEEAEVVGEHIMVPGYGDNGPTLEILSYKPLGKDVPLECYDFGFTHICFETPGNIVALLDRFLEHGGTLISQFEDPYKERVIYGRDPEGNIVEIRRPNDVPDTIRVTK